jgi:hypothetical protein
MPSKLQSSRKRRNQNTSESPNWIGQSSAIIRPRFCLQVHLKQQKPPTPARVGRFSGTKQLKSPGKGLFVRCDDYAKAPERLHSALHVNHAGKSSKDLSYPPGSRLRH